MARFLKGEDLFFGLGCTALMIVANGAPHSDFYKHKNRPLASGLASKFRLASRSLTENGFGRDARKRRESTANFQRDCRKTPFSRAGK
jgi:hypothetical protein